MDRKDPLNRWRRRGELFLSVRAHGHGVCWGLEYWPRVSIQHLRLILRRGHLWLRCWSLEWLMDARTGSCLPDSLDAWDSGPESVDLQAIYAKCLRAWR